MFKLIASVVRKHRARKAHAIRLAEFRANAYRVSVDTETFARNQARRARHIAFPDTFNAR